MQPMQQVTQLFTPIAHASRRTGILLMLLCGLALMVGGCTVNPVSEAATVEGATAEESTAEESTAEESTAATWHQGFEEDTTGWLSQTTSGPNGWCGDVQRYKAGSGPVSPAAGTGYAVISHGGCNDVYAEAFPDGGSPYAPTLGYDADGPIYSESTPPGGYVTAVDVYLDPSWADGAHFTYGVSVHLLDVAVDDAVNNPFRYFFLPVRKANGALEIAGHEIADAGWYTFQAHIRDDSGQLAVDFALTQDDEILATQSITPTLFTGEPTAPVMFTNVGTGYSIFDLAEGQSLAIDEHRYRPAESTTPSADAPAPTVVEVTATGLTFDAPATVPAE